MLSAALTIVIFYIFIAITTTGLLVLIAVEMLLAIIVARLGLSRFVIRYAETHIRLLGLLGKRLWLRRGTTYRLKLEPQEAPGIVSIMNRLAGQLNISPPDEIFIEMNAGAWIELRGLRRTMGKNSLGIGYDLLAGLTQHEVEAVLAHELVHSQKVFRLYKRWLNSGLHRAAGVSGQLSAIADANRKANKPFALAETILSVADRLTRWCAKFVAAYSRQDEFEADAGAVELCGSSGLRSALVRLESINDKLVRLPWNERLAQIQSREGLSNWLVQELSTAGGKEVNEAQHLFDRYSTHPALPDRLAALPPDPRALPDSPPGLDLLADANEVARKLMVEIQRVQLEVEAKDLKSLKLWRKKIFRRSRINSFQLPGLILGLAVIMFGFVALGSGWPITSCLIFGLGLPAAVWLFVKSRYRDRKVLPRPDYPTLTASWSNRTEIKDITAVQKDLDGKLRQKIAGVKKTKAKINIVLEEAYGALSKGDYLTAHVAGRVGVSLSKKSAESALVLAIASAAYHQNDHSGRSLQAVLNLTGFRSSSTRWGASWTFILLGSWAEAEALLHLLLEQEPEDATLLALMALCQSQRGKLQNAVANIRKTCDPQPASREHVKLLIRLLLDRGDKNEASRWLQTLQEDIKADRDLVYAMIRLHLLQREFGAASEYIDILVAQAVPGNYLIGIARLLEGARRDDQAKEFYERAKEQGYYPEALLGLARLANHTHNKDLTRFYTLAALDTTKPLGEKANSTFSIFPNALAQLVALQDPLADCQAWIARFPEFSKPGPLTKHSLMVFAREEKEAIEYAEVILNALSPNQGSTSLPKVTLTRAPKDLQPARPVRPGVQYVYT